MKTSFLGLIIWLSCAVAFSQKSYELSHQVMVPSAAVVTVGGISYQHTVGEAAVEILVTPDNTLTQGFQQPRFVPEIILPPREGNGVDFFPNPVTEEVYYIFNIRFYGLLARSYNLVITSLIGSVVYTDNIELPADHDYLYHVDMSQFGYGIYVARVISTDGVINRSFKVEKL